MLPDYFVNHVPGLYLKLPNTRCCSHCGRWSVSRSEIVQPQCSKTHFR